MTSTINGYLFTNNYKPNKFYITNNPVPQVCSQNLCCNQEKFALNRVKTIAARMKPNYYSNTKQYLHARCNTFEQKTYNYSAGYKDPYTNTEVYFANCQPNSGNTTEQNIVFNILQIFVQLEIIPSIPREIITMAQLQSYMNTLPSPNNEYALNVYFWYMNDSYVGFPSNGPSINVCKNVIYKPSNKQFSNQGAVPASQYSLYLNYNTISTSKVPTMIGKLKYGTNLTCCNGTCVGCKIKGGS